MMKKPFQMIKKIHDNPRVIYNHILIVLRIMKLWTAWLLLLPIKNTLYKKNIWLIGEKGTEARDNGYYFFKYIREYHSDINAFYTISKNSPDRNKVKKYGNIITLNSYKHFLFYLSAKVSANSQPYGAIPEPVAQLFQLSKKLHRNDQVVIHLKHGITKDELPHVLDYKNTHFDLICCVSERERKFMQEVHKYPDDNIKTVGFCRFDTLLNNHSIKKQILIMPTHRMWLHAAKTGKTANENEKEHFRNTEFFCVYASLLKNKELLEYVRHAGYNIVFYPHYALQSFIQCFEECANETVIIADRDHYDVQQLLLESALLITDFSSVFFDFAYMEKPVVFYQFDEQKYRAGHFKKGYFDYYVDGFGPVFKEEKDVITEIIRIIHNGCVTDEVYKERAHSFFTIRDANNCERVFNEVYRKAIIK